MRGELLLKALEFIGEAAAGTGQFIEAFLISNKSDYRALRDGPDIRPKFLSPEAREQQRFYSLFYRLQQDGLIAKTTNNRKSFWTLTTKGEEKRLNLLSYFKHKLPNPNYQHKTAKTITIISFDVPEKERHKRVWLRAVLKNLNFRLLQKSVWIGKTKIPKRFLEDLRKMRLIRYVEIFSINKRGSIQHLA